MEITRGPLASGRRLDVGPEDSRGAADLSTSLEELEQRIATRTAGRIRDLRIESVGDAVVLSGRTTTYYVKQLATQIALDEPGDLSALNLTLQNRIDVM